VTSTLILMRHGQSTWNLENLFTGWWDVDLTPAGEAEARRGGQLLAEAGLLPDVLHTSLLTRAIRTSTLALESAGRVWLPVRRSWRLNERHYGDLQGKDKKQTLAQFGEEKFMQWRRSYDVPPPPIATDSAFDVSDDPRYAGLGEMPRTECLADVVARLLPYWQEAVVPDLAHGTVLVVAHGNSLRAIVKHLEGISDADIAEVNIPTGNPLVFQMDGATAVGPGHYLDPEAAAAGAAAVASQGR
jgi:2,3-bisphosphoglycerate-dependent phosphoglycerate mutase